MQFENDWTWDNLYEAIQAVDDLLVSAPHRVDLIVDVREGLRIPGDFKAIARDLLANPAPRPNEGTKVIVGANGFMRLLYNGVRKIYAHRLGERRLLFTDTVEEAQALIRENNQDA